MMITKTQVKCIVPVPWTDAEAAPLLHPGDVLLRLLHLGVDLVHVALDSGQLLCSVPRRGGIV